MTDNSNHKRILSTSLPKVDAGFVAPILLFIGAIVALTLIFKVGNAWWDDHQAAMLKRSEEAEQVYRAQVVDAGEARQLADMVEKTTNPKIKDALKAALADDRFTNGEAMTVRDLLKSELAEAERLAALERLKQAARN